MDYFPARALQYVHPFDVRIRLRATVHAKVIATVYLTCARAVSITALSLAPNLYVLDGFPHSSQKYGRIASKTSGRTGVVALWSR